MTWDMRIRKMQDNRGEGPVAESSRAQLVKGNKNENLHPAWDILKKINDSMLCNKEWLISVSEQLASYSYEKIQSVAMPCWTNMVRYEQ